MGLHKLQESTISRLSSSQVITSVASVVKELVENALDAGATAVDVRLENYGLDKIVVKDNGCGLKPSEVACVAKKHYTSKLTCFDDLNNLTTYGFRGEALASLCSVADVSMTTRSVDTEVASTFEFDCNGDILSSTPSHLPQGTTVTVGNLFKRFPVRRNYYSTSKRCQDELRRVDDCLVAFAVIRCTLRMTFRHNGTVVWTKAATSDVQHSLSAVVGSSAVAAMKHIQRNCLQPSLQIEAMLPLAGSAGLPATRSTNDRIFVYVNMRPVTFTSVTKLLREYFCQAVPPSDVGRYPVAFLHLVVPSADVDVNLEPNKSQVLMHNKEEMLKLLACIFEEVYGQAVADSELSAVDVTNSADSCRQVACSSQPTVVTVTNTCTVMRPPAAEAEVSVSDIQSSTVCDVVIRPAVSSSSMPLEPSDVTSDVVSRQSDVARSWSAGTLLTDSSGKSVEPVRLLTGSSLVNNGTLQTTSSTRPPDIDTSPAVAPSTLSNINSELTDLIAGRQSTTCGQSGNVSNNGPGSDAEPPKTRLKRKTTNADKLASKRSKSDSEKGLKTICLEKLLSSPRFQSRTVSRESLSVSLNFSMSRLRKRLQAVDMSLTADVCASVSRPLELVGRLKSHGIWVCVTDDERLVLFHLARAQEQMLFARMMASHVLPTQDFQQPVRLDVRSLGSTDRYNTLLSMAKSEPVPTNPCCYFTDQRIVANGFAIREYKDSNAEGRVIEMTGAANCISYYGIADLNEVLSAIQLNNLCNLSACRSVKVQHYFQGEAVRLAHQLNVDVTVSEVRDILTELTNIVPPGITHCFHNRPFIIPLVNLDVCRRD